jgi:hypothetical protein
MSAVSGPEWRRIIKDLHRWRRDPFDGRRADMLLGVGLYLSTTAKGSRVVLKPTRELYGERIVRRYVSVYVGSNLLVMVVKPTRSRNGKPGRQAVYELRRPDGIAAPQDAQKGAAKTTAKRGSDSCSEVDPGSEPDSCSIAAPLRAQTVVPSSYSAARSPERLTMHVRLLVPLAARRTDWLGWQTVAPRVTQPLAAAS